MRCLRAFSWLLLAVVSGVPSAPNIVLVIVDDLGWSDVGFTTKPSNAEIPETPNLDKLAQGGVILENFYTQSVCTPTRASLFTGKYPHKLGLLYAYNVIKHGEKDGVGRQHTFFTQELAELKYKVHGVGKWHLGAEPEHRALRRGFDTWYGPYSGMIDYFTHRTSTKTFRNNTWVIECSGGYNFHYDYHKDSCEVYTDIGPESDGIHATDLFTKEAIERVQEHDLKDPMFLYVAYTAPHSTLQPKEEIVRTRNKHISEPGRRRYAALVTHVDEGVGEIVSALKHRRMWDNTFFMFMSDNGACRVRGCWDHVGGSNAPYRGGKTSMFEGGIKSAAFITSPWIAAPGTRSNALLHVVDVYPLIMGLSHCTTLKYDYGGNYKHKKVELEQWDGEPHILNIMAGINTGRDTIVHNIALGSVPTEHLSNYCKVPLPQNYSVIRHKQYKMFRGLAEWCRSGIPESPCPSSNHDVMLFDLSVDPGESENVAADNVPVVEYIVGLLKEFSKDAVRNWA